MHLAEVAALQMKKYNDAVDMDIFVRKKPFREEKQGGFVNDIDSDEEDQKAKPFQSEFLGGGGESDCDEIEDTEGDLTIRRQAIRKCTLEQCKDMLSRKKEVERANAPGRTKEADAQMKKYANAFQSILQKDLPPVSAQHAPPAIFTHPCCCQLPAQREERDV